MNFSRLSEKFIGQKMFVLLESARKLERQGRNLIHFELGDPDFKTPKNIIAAAIKALENDETHYVESSGIYDLRKAACTVTLRSRGFLPDIEQTLVTCGANMQIYLALACMCDPRDEVIIPNPYFPTYLSSIRALDLTPIEIRLEEVNGFRMNAEDVYKKISKKTKVILINSPSNPTGSVMTNEDMKEIFQVAREQNLWLISDEVYARQIYEGSFFSPSTIDQCKERVVIVNGFSKSFAMTGWRLGVVTGPRNLIERMQTLLETIISCVPSFIQRAGIAGLLEDQTEITKMTQEFKKRSILMTNGLNSIKGLRCIKPKGAMYCWVNIVETGMQSENFAKLLLEKGVVISPGTIFGREDYIRLCFCTSDENIKEGLRRMKEWYQ